MEAMEVNKPQLEDTPKEVSLSSIPGLEGYQ